MKKFIVWMLATVMLVCSAVAGAEERTIDVSSYTLDELVEIRKEIGNEIVSRLTDKNADMIFRGQYVVGKDIKAGRYIFTCMEAAMGSSTPEGDVTLYKIVDRERFEEKGSGLDEIYSTGYLDAGHTVMITLENDMVLEIRDCSGTLRVCEQSWSVPNE